MTNLLKIIVLAIVFLTPVKQIFAKGLRKPICIYELCVSKKTTKKSVINKLGDGAALKPEGETGGLCYNDPVNKTWIYFSFSDADHDPKKRFLEGVFITQENLCGFRKTIPKAMLNHLYTSLNVQIGMTKQTVLDTLGPPSRIDDAKKRESQNLTFWQNTLYSAKFGDQVLVYNNNDEAAFAFIFLEKDRIKTIWYSESE